LLLGAGIARVAVAGASLFQGSKAAQKLISAYQSSRTLGTALKAGAIQGAVESIVATPAMLYDQKTTFDYDPTAEDAVLDVATNIIGGSVFEGLGYGFGKFLKKFSSKQQEDLVGAALTLGHEGKKFDYEQLQRTYIKDTLLPRDGESVGIGSKYIVGGFDNGEFYASFNTKVPKITDLSTNNVIDYSYGDGLILTDNPSFASRAAAKAYTGEEGSTVKVKINTESLVDTTFPPAPEVAEAIENTLAKYFSKNEIKQIVTEGATLRKILDNIDRYQITETRDIDFQNEVNTQIASLGFEG